MKKKKKKGYCCTNSVLKQSWKKEGSSYVDGRVVWLDMVLYCTRRRNGMEKTFKRELSVADRMFVCPTKSLMLKS